jgi:hypothetical protein
MGWPDYFKLNCKKEFKYMSRRFNTNQVCRIRHAINVEGASASTVAKRYNASPSSVRRIASGQSYKDVPEARSIPGFPNYLAYPDGRVWSSARGRFIKPVAKGSSPTRYYNLTSNGNRTSLRADRITNYVF